MLTIGLFSTAAWMTDPRVRMLSCAARGTFVDMIASADIGETTGSISINGVGPTMQQLARLFHVNDPRTIERHVEEIVSKGLVTVDSSGVISIPLQSYVDRYLTGKSRRNPREIPGKSQGNTGEIPGKSQGNTGDLPEAQMPIRGKPSNVGNNKPASKPDPVQISSKTSQINDLEEKVSFHACARAVVVDSYLESKNLESVEEREGTVSQPNLSGALNHKKTNREDSGRGEGGVGGEKIGRKNEPAASVGAQKARPPRPASARGTRIDPEFSLTPSLREFAVSLGVNPDWELGKFVDYWLQRSDVRAYKPDWNAAWRNWVRKEASSPARSPSGAQAPNAAPRREPHGTEAMAAYLARQTDLLFDEVDVREKFADDVVDRNAPVIDGTILP
jgi:hypothetical protein